MPAAVPAVGISAVSLFTNEMTQPKPPDEARLGGARCRRVSECRHSSGSGVRLVVVNLYEE